MVHNTILGFLYLVNLPCRGCVRPHSFNEDILGIGGHFDLQEMCDTLPEIKVLTFFLAIGFVLLHGLSGKLNGGKMWLARRHPLVWGTICGLMLTLAFYLRPAETIDFIYFRF